MKKKLYITLINDLAGDQRMHRIATALMEMGFEVHLVGRKLPDSRPLNRPYACHRMKLLFTKGKFFYLEYNLRLFFFLLFRRVDVLNSCDLDTLLAGYLLSRLKQIPLVYDSHEYFTEVPELVGRPATQKIWVKLEQWIFPKLKHAYTVNESLAQIYSKKYGVQVNVVGNLPFSRPLPSFEKKENILIYQGALNLGRGIEMMIRAMTHLPTYKLWIVGKGDVEDELRALSQQLKLEEGVIFKGFVPMEELHQLTPRAKLGFSLEENLGKNYYYASPNKVFDYIQAGVPVLVSDLPEMKKVVEEHGVGEVLTKEERNEEALAERIRALLNKEQLTKTYSEACKKAAKSLTWEKEKKRLQGIFRLFL